jgi:hypothetical protein
MTRHRRCPYSAVVVLFSASMALVATDEAAAQAHEADTTAAKPRAVRNLLGGSTPAFLSLARRVANGTEGEKAEFARVSLEEMGGAFHAEAEKAFEYRPDPGKPGNEQKDPRKWASATEGYAGRLFGLSESIMSGAVVDVRVEQEGTVLLIIDGSTVIVSGPNIAKPEILENRIIDRVCLDPSCDSLATATFDPNYTPSVSGRWSYTDTQSPVYATSNGLNFLFEDSSNLTAKEAACSAIANELASIVTAIRNLLWQKQSVDWNAIAVRPDATDATTQVLRINPNGDFVKLALPQLVQVPYVLQSALPWVRSQVEGRYNQHYVQLPPGTFD